MERFAEWQGTGPYANLPRIFVSDYPQMSELSSVEQMGIKAGSIAIEAVGVTSRALVLRVLQTLS